MPIYKYSLFVKEFTSQIEIFNMVEEYEHEICFLLIMADSLKWKNSGSGLRFCEI